MRTGLLPTSASSRWLKSDIAWMMMDLRLCIFSWAALAPEAMTKVSPLVEWVNGLSLQARVLETFRTRGRTCRVSKSRLT